MAKIVIYDPLDVDVPYRVTEYHRSGHTPDFDSEPNKIIDPEFIDDVKDQSVGYWKVVPGSPPDSVTEMTQAEKDIIDVGNIVSNGGYAESETASSSSSTTYQNKLTMMSTNLKDGTYDVSFYCETANTNTSSRTQVEVEVDGTVIAEPSIETEDSSDWVPYCGFKQMVLSGDITITIKYRRNEGSGTASIRRARIKLQGTGGHG